MISTDQAIEMLPFMADIFDKIDVKGYRKKVSEENKVKNIKVDPIDAGIDFFKYVMKNAPKIKTEIFEIVAIAKNKNADEISKQSYVTTIATFKEIFFNKELLDFFKQAMQ